MDRQLIVKQFPSEYFELFGKMPSETFRRKETRLNGKLRDIIKRRRIPKRVLPPDIDSLIFLAYRGSVSFGTYERPTVPTSIDDIDLIGCYVNPIKGYFGFGDRHPKHYELKYNKWDCIHYEFKKMMTLLAKGNPNVLSTLWLPEDKVIYSHPMWNNIIKNRKMFVSRFVYSAFSGYGNNQLRRMTHNAFKGYMGPKRRQLVEKFGYDTKNASHLIRLLTMGIEFLENKKLLVDRTNIDKKLLLDIKHGEYKLTEIKEMADELFKKGKKIFVDKKSEIPSECDMDGIEGLMVNQLMTWHRKNIVKNKPKPLQKEK